MPLKEEHTIHPRRANNSWNIPMNSFSNHLNGKIKFKKMGLEGVLIKEENV